jgi:hypothetical protein
MTDRHPNTGKSPRNKTIPLGIEFECGHIAGRPYTANQLVWEKRGLPFDIKTFWRLSGGGGNDPT